MRAAEEVLMDSRLIRMSRAGFHAFMRYLAGPATAVPEMAEVVRRRAPWEEGGSKR